ncbi:MmgE/PrpD family protein [Halobaculum gomorrense]|uniref:2-methylcitrate dehydratase PrpD n=1 Tax=Halobaculum gomorrense TaxID=43928 RepID=A0A1M5JM72_9EURY|nr:MmgE/PrpD family protein [Halobaculum gomorrense]SHG41360.1 2-methylcitrate dehydratase PrpD [Halobaculum gomorrense]
MTDTATDTLIEHCRCAPDRDRPPAVDRALRRHLLDTVGVALGAREHAGSSPSIERAARRLAGASGSEGTGAGADAGAATVWATGERLPAGEAALLNGAHAHSLDFDDTHRESSLHPGAPVVPAALAVAERRAAAGDPVDGERVLAGVRAGYDVACAVGRAVDPDAHYDRGFHVTATCGTFGATAAAGVVAGLSEAGFADAFGVNGSQAAGSLQFLANGAWNKRLHPGLSARRAVEAVTLAAEGFRGAADAVGGEHGFLAGYTPSADPGELADIGGREAVLETALKPYPCCRYMHSALDALCGLADEVDPDAVERVVVDLPKPGVTLTGDPIGAKRRPENLVDCQFSMPFGAALALSTGEAGLKAFLDARDRLDNPALRRLMDATEVVSTEATAEPFPERWAAAVVVETDDGDHHERFVEAAPGEPERPLDADAVEEKFASLAGSAGADADAVEAALAAARADPFDLDAFLDAVRAGVAEAPAEA